MADFEGTFKRASLMIQDSRIDLAAGWFAVSHNWVQEKSTRRTDHGKWHRIASDSGVVYRILRFSPNLKRDDKREEGDIVIDWMGWMDLSGRVEDVDQPLSLKVRRAHWWELPRCGLTHPDPSYRLSAALALLSAVLGIVSVVVALL
jgi:hypothetical protein